MIRISITRLKLDSDLSSMLQASPINDKNLDYEIETGESDQPSCQLIPRSMIRISITRLKQLKVDLHKENRFAINDKNLDYEIETLLPAWYWRMVKIDQ